VHGHRSHRRWRGTVDLERASRRGDENTRVERPGARDLVTARAPEGGPRPDPFGERERPVEPERRWSGIDRRARRTGVGPVPYRAFSRGRASADSGRSSRRSRAVQRSVNGRRYVGPPPAGEVGQASPARTLVDSPTTNPAHSQWHRVARQVTSVGDPMLQRLGPGRKPPSHPGARARGSGGDPRAQPPLRTSANAITSEWCTRERAQRAVAAGVVQRERLAIGTDLLDGTAEARSARRQADASPTLTARTPRRSPGSGAVEPEPNPISTTCGQAGGGPLPEARSPFAHVRPPVGEPPARGRRAQRQGSELPRAGTGRAIAFLS